MTEENLKDIDQQNSNGIDIGEGKPGNSEARDQYKLGNFYTESMIYEHAVDAYKRAIQIDPNYAEAHHNLGAVYYKMGLFDEAQEELKIAIQLRPNVPLFHYTLGLVLEDDKQLKECIYSFSMAISLSPNYIDAYYHRGSAYYHIGVMENACSDFEKVIELSPEFRDALHNLGTVYISLKRWQDARRVFQQQLSIKPGDPDAFYHIALIYIESGDDLEVAMDNLQKAIALDPEHLEARFQLALVYARRRYRDSSYRNEAITQIRALIELYKEIEDFDHIHDAFFLLGGLYDDEPDDMDLAIEAYEKGIQLADWSAEAHNNLGVLYSQKGATDKAVKEFRTAIRLDPDYGSPYHNLARVYFYQRNEEILKDFQQWIVEMPEESAKILFNLSLALMDVGRAEACESVYSKAHKVKNLIGVAGSKIRRTIREINSKINESLMDVLSDQEKCYNEMVNLLGALKHEGIVLDMVDVNAIIETALFQIGFKPDTDNRMLRLGNVNCRMDITESLPKVKGDPRRLKEVFNNIVINALEAMNNSGSLQVSTKYSDATSEIEIIFCDTGTGIPAKDLDNIFKPGYTTKESGSGFGLSIANRIIMEHKGSISISSYEGKGTEARIHLPVNLELAPIQTNLRMRPVIYEDPGKLISTEVDQIVGV